MSSWPGGDGRKALGIIPAILWWAEPSGQYVVTNSQWEVRTGRTEAQAQHYGWLDAIHPDDVEDTRLLFERAFVTCEPLERLHRIHRMGDGYRWHLVRQIPVFDQTGSVVVWSGSALDVEEINAAARQRPRTQVSSPNPTRAVEIATKTKPFAKIEAAANIGNLGDHLLFARALADRVDSPALKKSIDISLLLLGQSLSNN